MSVLVGIGVLATVIWTVVVNHVLWRQPMVPYIQRFPDLHEHLGDFHLLIHGDDLRTQALITDCGPRGAWEKLQVEGRRLPDFAASFLEKYAQYFPSVVDTAGNDWEGGAPGLSGTYSYIWVKSSDDFRAELIKFLKSEKIH